MSSARTGPKRTDKSGYVYVISNKAWPGMSKIGSTSNIRRRLTAYNTGSPHRDYKIHEFLPTRDRMATEALLHEQLAGFRVGKTEWFRLHPGDACLFLRMTVRGEAE